MTDQTARNRQWVVLFMLAGTARLRA